MVGYLLGNTVTEHGHVARGVCQEDEEHYLLRVTEHTHIEKAGADARSTVDGGETWTRLPGDTVVSMNLWGFTPSFLWEAEARFPAFLDQVLARGPPEGGVFPAQCGDTATGGEAGPGQGAAQHRQVVWCDLSGG